MHRGKVHIKDGILCFYFLKIHGKTRRRRKIRQGDNRLRHLGRRPRRGRLHKLRLLFFGRESRHSAANRKMGFARAAGSASAIGAHGRADEDKGEIYFKHGGRKSRFIKSLKSAKSLKFKASVKRMPLFVERSRKTLQSGNRYL